MIGKQKPREVQRNNKNIKNDIILEFAFLVAMVLFRFITKCLGLFFEFYECILSQLN